MNSKINAFFELIRPLNVLITFLSIGAACIMGRGNDWVSILAASAAGAFIAAGANVINDYFDVAIDRINKPHRPLPRGALSREQAWVSWFGLSAVGILLNVFLNFGALGIAIGAVIALYVYSARLKKTLLAGNILVAAMTSLAFTYGGVAVGNIRAVLMPALFAFLINLAREVIKDMEDMEGDREEGAQTLPIRYGARPSLVLATTVLFLLIAATVIPFLLNLYGGVYYSLILVIDGSILFIIISMWRDASPKNLARLSMFLKVNMVAGLCAIFFGSL